MHDHSEMAHGHEHHHMHGDDSDHSHHSVSMFRDKFWLSLLLSVPVILYSEIINNWFGFSMPEFTGSQYIPFIFSTIIFFYGGLVFLKSAWGELKQKRPGMMTLIAIAISVAYFYSVATQFFIEGESFFWELASLVVIMLLGHWIEMASVMKASSATDELIKLLPDKAERVLKNGKTKIVKVSQLKVGDKVLVKPGSSVSVDGVVVDGESVIDESMITGESALIEKTIDSKVVAGTKNQEGALTIKVENIGPNTVLSNIIRLVKEAQNTKTKAQLLADKAAFVLTIVAVSSALIAFVYWSSTVDVNFALERAVTTLIIACPHALGLAIPLVISISTTLSARNGLLFRQRLALEQARKVKWVLFDKTGTLTEGKLSVSDIYASKHSSRREVLTVTASLEAKSEHSIGLAIFKEAEFKKLKTFKVTDFKALPGMGVRAKLTKNGKVYQVVSRKYIDSNNDILLSKTLEKRGNSVDEEGKTGVYLVSDNRVLGIIALSDSIRADSKKTINRLKAQKINVAMVTGDSLGVAKQVADMLGIAKFYAGVLPEDKAKVVKSLQGKSHKVMFVGDGVNDAPALASSDVGVAIGTGTDVAIETADILLTDSNPLDVTKVVKLSKAAHKKMLQNLFWAAGYNIITIPLAAGVLYNHGVTLSPAFGAVLMTLSTVVVALNAQFLRKLNFS